MIDNYNLIANAITFAVECNYRAFTCQSEAEGKRQFMAIQSLKVKMDDRLELNLTRVFLESTFGL